MFVYRVLALILTPFYAGLALYRVLRGKDTGARIAERFGLRTARPQGGLVWVHAASVGETLSILPLVERTLRDFPDLNILMTTYTRTAGEIVARRKLARVTHRFIPYDHPVFAALFLSGWQPDAVVWVESEFWPDMLTQIKVRNIPAALVNVRFSHKSHATWKKYAPDFIRRMLGAFSFVHAQTDEYAGLVGDLAGRPADMVGNLKYAAAPLACDSKALEGLRDRFSGRDVLLFASTHKGEEEIAIDMHKRLKSLFPALLTIIVPRHPDRGGKIVEMVNSAGLSVGLRSTETAADGKKDGADARPAGHAPGLADGSAAQLAKDVYVADTLGELGLFYRLCDISVVGNSFVHDPGGGHNPLEPAHLDCAVVYGPSMYNFSAMDTDMKAANCIVQVPDTEGLFAVLSDLLSDADKSAALAARAKTFAQKGSSALDELYVRLIPALKLSDKFASQDKFGEAAE